MGCGGKPSFPSTSAGDLSEIPMVPLRGEGCCGVGGGPRVPSGLAQWKRALPPGEAGTSGRLRFGLRLQGPCIVGTGESGLVLSEEGISACLSSCSGGLRPLVELRVEPAGFPEHAQGCQCPFVLCLNPHVFLQRCVRASGSFQDRTRKSGSFGLWHHPRG